MQVRLKNTWFAPTPRKVLNPIFSTVGRRYKPGVHTISEDLREFLPSTAEVLDDTVVAEPEVVEAPAPTLKDFDMDRANAEEFNRVAEEAEKPSKKAEK